jgi:hypothetical protein
MPYRGRAAGSHPVIEKSFDKLNVDAFLTLAWRLLDHLLTMN